MTCIGDITLFKERWADVGLEEAWLRGGWGRDRSWLDPLVSLPGRSSSRSVLVCSFSTAWHVVWLFILPDRTTSFSTQRSWPSSKRRLRPDSRGILSNHEKRRMHFLLPARILSWSSPPRCVSTPARRRRRSDNARHVLCA